MPSSTRPAGTSGPALFVSVALLSAASAVLLHTLRQVRGRPHAVDAAVPMLVMNPGGYENLLLGYQMHFTIDVLLIAGFVRCVALADLRPARATAWRVSVLTGLLALGGWVGLAFVPGATAWVARLVRRGRRADALALVVPLLACGFFAWSYAETRQHPSPGQLTNDWPATARVAGEFFGMAFGTLGPKVWPASGLLIGACGAAVVGSCGAAIGSPGRRPVAVGTLAVVLALVLMAYGTGRHRESGFAFRNVQLLAFLPLLGLIHVVKFAGPARREWENAATAAVLMLAAAVQLDGWREAERAGGYQRTKYEMFAADRDAGLPLEFLVSRHQMFPCSEVYAGTRLLRSRGHPFARGVVDLPPCDSISLPLPPASPRAVPGDPTPEWVAGRPPVWHFTLPKRRAVTGVRVKLRYPRACERAAIQVLWPKPDGSTGMTACMPWLTPNDWTLDFWVDDELGEFWLRPLSEADAFEVLSAELLVPK